MYPINPPLNPRLIRLDPPCSLGVIRPAIGSGLPDRLFGLLSSFLPLEHLYYYTTPSGLLTFQTSSKYAIVFEVWY